MRLLNEQLVISALKFLSEEFGHGCCPDVCLGLVDNDIGTSSNGFTATLIRDKYIPLVQRVL